MILFVTMKDGKTIAIEILKNQSIRDIKIKIKETSGVDPDEHEIVFEGCLLEDGKTIDEYQIREKSVIGLVDPLR